MGLRRRRDSGRGFRPLRISTNSRKSPGPTLTDGTSGFLQGGSLGGLGMVGTVETLTLVGQRDQARLPFGVALHMGVKFFDKLQQSRSDQTAFGTIALARPVHRHNSRFRSRLSALVFRWRRSTGPAFGGDCAAV